MGLLRLKHIFFVADYADLTALGSAFGAAARPYVQERSLSVAIRGHQYAGKTAFCRAAGRGLVTGADAQEEYCRPKELGWDSTFWINRISETQRLQVRVRDRRAIGLMSDELIKEAQGFRDAPTVIFNGLDMTEHPSRLSLVRPDIRIRLATPHNLGIAETLTVSCAGFGTAARIVKDFIDSRNTYPQAQPA